MTKTPLATATSSKTWRSPAFGMIPPGGRVSVTIEKILDLEHDAPILVSWPTNSGLVMEEITESRITIGNPTLKPSAFALFFTRRKLLNAATFDWRDLFARLARLRRKG